MTPVTQTQLAEVLDVSRRTVVRKAMHTVADLPPEAQARWAAAERQEPVEIAPAPGQLALALTAPAGPNLSDVDREEAEARYRIIAPVIESHRYVQLWRECGSRNAVMARLAEKHQVAARTLYRWARGFEIGGLPALVTRARADKGQPRALNGAALDFLLAAALPRRGAYGELTAAEIYRAYGEERAWRAAHAGEVMGEFERRKYARYLDEAGRLKAEAQLPAAAYRTFSEWFGRIPQVVRVMARQGEAIYAATQEIISFRNLAEVQPLDYLVMDHRRLDFFCLVRAGQAWRLVRPWLTAALDMRTRKWLAWVIVEQPSSDSIASVLRRVIMQWGVPHSCYWDNGKDFCCEWLEGRERKERRSAAVEELAPAMRGILQTLGIRVHHAIVKRARSKIIEPNFLNTSLFDRSLPWWCGHNPAARPERFGALVEQHEKWVKGETAEAAFPTIERVAQLYGEFLDGLNEREHTGEGMRKVTPTGQGWMCPNECWELLIRRVPRVTVTAELMQFAFAKRRRLTVRQGEIRATFGGRQFHYRALGNPIALMALNGREVEIAYDPYDLETAAVYADDQFVGLVANAELRRMGEDAFVADERARRAARREIKGFIEAVHQAVHVPGAEERMTRRLAVREMPAEPARIEAAADVPQSVRAAAEAAREERRFSFAQANAQVAAIPAPASDGDDGAFEFFGGSGA